MQINDGIDQNEHLYDVTVSFAGEDRQRVKELTSILVKNDIKVFYDENEQASLWGKDLYQHLQSVYRDNSKYCVIFISKNYADKLWTKHEFKQAQARAFIESKEYILPIRLDDTELPGLNSTVAYMDLRQTDITSIADLLIQKIFSNKEHKSALNFKLGYSDSELQNIRNEINNSTLEMYYQRAKYLYNNDEKKKAAQELEIIIDKDAKYYTRVDTELDFQDNESIKKMLRDLLKSRKLYFVDFITKQYVSLERKYSTAINIVDLRYHLVNERDSLLYKVNNCSFFELSKINTTSLKITDLGWETRESVERKKLEKLQKEEKEKKEIKEQEERERFEREEAELEEIFHQKLLHERLENEKKYHRFVVVFSLLVSVFFIYLLVTGFLGILFYVNGSYADMFRQLVFSSFLIGVFVMPVTLVIDWFDSVYFDSDDFSKCCLVGAGYSIVLGFVYLLIIGNLLSWGVVDNIPFLGL